MTAVPQRLGAAFLGGSSAHRRACLSTGVHSEFGENALGVMPCRVGAYVQGRGDCGIRAPLREHRGHLRLSCSKAIVILEVGCTRLRGAITGGPPRCSWSWLRSSRISRRESRLILLRGAWFSAWQLLESFESCPVYALPHRFHRLIVTRSVGG